MHHNNGLMLRCLLLDDDTASSSVGCGLADVLCSATWKAVGLLVGLGCIDSHNALAGL